MLISLILNLDHNLSFGFLVLEEEFNIDFEQVLLG